MSAGADVLHVAPVLAEDVRQQARALAESGRLRRVVTGWAPRAAAPRWLERIPGLARAARRAPVPAPWHRISRVAGAEAIERALRAAGAAPADAVDARFARVDRRAARSAQAPARIVLAREDACLQTFRRARREGLVLVYDLPTAAHETVQRLLDVEAALFPGVCSVSRQPRDFAEDRCARKRAERSLADFILCPSRFVRDSLVAAGVRPERVRVLPFASDPGWLRLPAGPRQPLFLQVGKLTMRKGVHRLLAAWKRLGAHRTHRLRLIGPMHLEASFLRDYAGLYEHLPAMPRRLLAAQYARASAVVVNSIAEGQAMVIPEAMSCGAALIASRTSGAEGVITDGEEGRLVSYGDDDQLLAALDGCLGDPRGTAEMGAGARRAAARWTWPQYRAALVGWLAGLA